uniref:MFS general substrate transporter n=1 Tax=Moniliophthora roreri TaxID=221103 RepID=A0A0W0F096_MONRR
MSQPQSRDSQSSSVAKVSPGETVREEYDGPAPAEYKLYKRRFPGLIGIILLNIVGGMSWPWFGPIANDMVREFDISLDKVNWLGNLMSCVYIPAALLIPYMVPRYGMRRVCDLGAVCLVLAAWIRYAGTSRTLSGESAYALLMIGQTQVFAAIAQPLYQVLAPIYSEKWFDLKGRTTATMICSVANPVGGAIAQLLSPLVGDTRQSILVLGIICTAVTPLVFMVQSAPPTPPTYSASQRPPSLGEFVKVLAGRSRVQQISLRERLDFLLLVFIFGISVAATLTFSVLTSQIFDPYGYSADTSGLLGATLLLVGLVAAFITSPLFDRVFTKHLAITAKILIPCVGGAWLSLIWAVKPNNTGGLFAIMAIIGGISVTMLPIGLDYEELGCDLTRNAEASSSILWLAGNLFGVIFVVVEDALRAGPHANPPLNMHRSLIFHGVMVMVAAGLTLLLRGKQVRKELDQQKIQEVAGRVEMQQA